MDDGDRERLYGLPLDEFVRERDALARRLRKEGDRERSEAVKALAKPSVVAWTVNQLARRRSEDIRRLLDAADRLRAAQTTGTGDFAGAAAEQRDAVRALADAAGEVLREAGRAATDATLDRVVRTLTAAVADADARSELERGTLTQELEPTGFGSLLGALGDAGGDRETTKKPSPGEQAKARAALEHARERADALRRDVEAAERVVAETRRRLAAAEADAERAREARTAAEAEVERAERRLAES